MVYCINFQQTSNILGRVNPQSLEIQSYIKEKRNSKKLKYCNIWCIVLIFRKHLAY